MPIRMVKDREQPNDNGGNGRNDNNAGGGGGLGKGILGALLALLFKNPRLLIPLLLIGGAAYFFLGRETAGKLANNLLSMGCEMKTSVYDKAEVFEPLAVNAADYNIPDRVSLEKFCPTRLNQGQQGSCVGWSSSYSARTILQSIATGKNPDEVRFSPSSLYNQISLPGCQGAYIQNAMQVMQQRGVLPFSKFAYDENTCHTKPAGDQIDLMAQYRTNGYNRLTVSGENYSVDLNAIKQNLAQGAPVVIGMMVGGSFMQDMMGKDIWIPGRSDYNMYGFGGHAMCVIGYDDNYEGGAIQIMNSWGQEWGNNGLAWVRYKDFLFFTKEAYGLYPMGNAATNQKVFTFTIGLIDQDTEKPINLKKTADNTFETSSKVLKNSKFKISVNNKNEAYVYVFGRETDGSSYVLFPYTEKHSAYCGITGTRLFPKDYSMSPDETGTKDYFAIVVSKQQLNYNKVNEQINQSKGANYAEKVNNALQGEQAIKTNTSVDDYIHFDATGTDKPLTSFIIAVNKE